jgi:hypothetical protein
MYRFMRQYAPIRLASKVVKTRCVAGSRAVCAGIGSRDLEVEKMNTLQEVPWLDRAPADASAEQKAASVQQGLASSGRLNLYRIRWLRPLIESRWPQFVLRALALAGFVLRFCWFVWLACRQPQLRHHLFLDRLLDRVQAGLHPFRWALLVQRLPDSDAG